MMVTSMDTPPSVMCRVRVSASAHKDPVDEDEGRDAQHRESVPPVEPFVVDASRTDDVSLPTCAAVTHSEQTSQQTDAEPGRNGARSAASPVDASALGYLVVRMYAHSSSPFRTWFVCTPGGIPRRPAVKRNGGWRL